MLTGRMLGRWCVEDLLVYRDYTGFDNIFVEETRDRETDRATDDREGSRELFKKWTARRVPVHKDCRRNASSKVHIDRVFLK